MNTRYSRYEAREGRNGYFEVFDIFTGRTVTIEGILVDTVTIDEADDMIHLLRAMDDKRSAHQQNRPRNH